MNRKRRKELLLALGILLGVVAVLVLLSQLG